MTPISILYKKAMSVPRTRNGAKGIWWFFNPPFIRSRTPNNAPIQKERSSAENPPEIPKSQPIPRQYFTSPKPIHLPFEINHIKKIGSATRGPARNKLTEGITN